MSEKPAPEHIERAREARQDSFRAALTEAAKAQQEASSVTFAMASESGRGWDPDAHLIPIAKAIAAAEERGRRSGVEERDELRALLREEMERQHYVAAPGPESEDMDLCGGCGNAWPCEDADCFVFKARALLAPPRDSAPDLVVCDYCPEHPHPLNDDGTKCVHPRAPRDSGKENT